MLLLTRRFGSCSLILAICFITGCGQRPEANKLIEQINGATVKARMLANEAETKRAQAKEKADAEQRTEHDQLIEEASKLYGQISELLYQSAKQADQVVKLKNPEWYREYFTLHSKLIRNLALLARGAQEELLVRKSGAPTELQLKSWKENINRLAKENQEYRKQIAEIESKHGVALIKEE